MRHERIGSEERLPRVTPDMVDDWLRHASLRAANLFYLAGDPSPSHRDRALQEMTQALREALEEVRVVAEELRREAALHDAAPQSDQPVEEGHGAEGKSPDTPHAATPDDSAGDERLAD